MPRCSALLSVREGLSLSLSAHAANFSCQVQLPECTGEIGCLCFFSFSSLLVASPSLSPPLHTWLPDLFYLSSAGGNTNPGVSFSSSSSLMMFLRIHLAGYRAVIPGTRGCTRAPQNKIKVHTAGKTGVVGVLTG